MTITICTHYIAHKKNTTAKNLSPYCSTCQSEQVEISLEQRKQYLARYRCSVSSVM